APLNMPEEMSAACGLVRGEREGDLLGRLAIGQEMAPEPGLYVGRQREDSSTAHFPSRNRAAIPTAQFSKLAPVFGSAVGRQSPSGVQEKIPQTPPNGGCAGAGSV